MTKDELVGKVAHRATFHDAKRAFADGATVLVSDSGQDRVTVHRATTVHTRETTTWEALADQVREWRNRYPNQRYYVVESGSVRPELGSITRHAGIAGQFSYRVPVTYPGEPTQTVEFVGSVYDGPVVMVTPTWPGGVDVTDPSRFGDFSPAWVRRFFGWED